LPKKPHFEGVGYSFTMKLGKAFSIVLLLAVTLSSVGFTTLAWYCPMSKKADQEKTLCHSCKKEKEQKPNCEDDDCCKQQAELMKLQPDLSAAVKLQPNLDSPEMDVVVQLLEVSSVPVKRWSPHQFVRSALPDRVAHEHTVLRI
jgi:hypothetical protein